MPKLKRPDSAERATDFVESLDRGLRLLQKFGVTSGPMTLSDLARAAGLPRATARRILFTLEHGGFVATDGKLFTLTPHVLTLAASYLRSNQVVSVLQPVLDRIATAAQEISSLAVLDGDEVVFIARGSPARVFSAASISAIACRPSAPRSAAPCSASSTMPNWRANWRRCGARP